jgi:biotin synthase
MDRATILTWLRETDEKALAALWSDANAARRAHVGDAVHLRGLVEMSNHCARQCLYCGLRGANHLVPRYRMTSEEVLACAHEAWRLGYGTVVIQTGEDDALTGPLIADLVRRVKAETPLAVTLSLGERSDADLRLWRAAGADRYLLRFETSNRALFDWVHPPRGRRKFDRVAMLGRLREFGYEVGSGVMIGIPGQSYDDLADDLEAFVRLDLDMIGVGPFLPHPDTPLGKGSGPARLSAEHQVVGDELTTYKFMALARLLCPRVNMPATTALATLNKVDGRENALRRGANVVMPNVTPPHYRRVYMIYPDKACLHETAAQCQGCLAGRIAKIGRTIGEGRGDSPNRMGRPQYVVAANERNG